MRIFTEMCTCAILFVVYTAQPLGSVLSHIPLATPQSFHLMICNPYWLLPFLLHQVTDLMNQERALVGGNPDLSLRHQELLQLVLNPFSSIYRPRLAKLVTRPIKAVTTPTSFLTG
jgi:hypothetical protein